MPRLNGFRRIVMVALSLSFLLTLSTAVYAQGGAPATQFNVGLQIAGSGFESPLYVTHAGDGSKRIFVVEKGGTIRILRDGKGVDKPFLDITPIVNSSASERGLLGLAFHPKYKDNGLFYVYYTADSGDITISRYKVSSDPDVVDPASGKILLTVEHRRYPNHDGGQLAFGPDGYLYAGLGDGGSAGDPNRNGQNPNALLAKILRLDVNGGDPYGIPADNPFADGKAGKPEVWAYGLRNPWRFSFDRQTGDLYIGDVGQNKYEEIDFQKAGTPGGLNYGWNIMEGLHCYAQDNCSQQGLTLPVAEYSHDIGCSVTGGYVYRGSAFPRFQGAYFYGDYCSGRIWALQATGNSQWQATEVLQSGRAISSFGEDEAGELYLTDLNDGKVYRIVDQAQ
jgi:glucose/arabinose dehydrogenase